ncbi:MAG TPA: hypothetical protein VNS33_05975 [Bradyrhizobium sp.]|nr:hypothetical protein [Bradyrhizobium sp.]
MPLPPAILALASWTAGVIGTTSASPVLVSPHIGQALMPCSAVNRVWAQTSEEKTADREAEHATTGRGQDKSRQCAARSGSCFSWAFSPFRQGAPDPRNVRADIKLLLSLSFPHIAEAGDGA